MFIEADSVASKKMSGIGHTTLEILNALDRKIVNQKLQVTAIVPYGTKKYVLKYGWKNIKVRQLPPGYKYVNYALVRTSLPIPVDLLFGRGVYVFPNYKNWFVPFSRSITFIHDVVFKLHPETTHDKNLVYLNDNFPRWVKRTDGVVSISNQSAREVAAVFPSVKDKIETIYLGVNKATYFPREKKEIADTLTKYGIEDDYFLAVGNIEPRKNILKLLEAYKLYADNTTSAAQMVLIGGDGWKNKETLEYIENLTEKGYKVYRPKQYVEDEDLPMIYSGSRSLIHVAIHEGFGLPPVQAQACGAPVIVSDLAVFHETLSAVTATYVDYKNAQDIALAMQLAPSVLNGRKSSLRKGFTWDDTVNRLIKFAGIIN